MQQVNLNVDFSEITGVIKPLHATNEIPTTDFCFGMAENAMNEFKEAGAPYSRLHDIGGRYGANVFVDISNVFKDFFADETNPENYDFAFTDKLIELLVKNGIRPYYRLGETIENDFFIKRYRTNPPENCEKWARICERIIMHYNKGWANGFKYDIKYWEIWNEPDNASVIEKNQMWGGTPEQFYELYTVTAIYLKSKFPEIKIGGYGSVGFYSIALKAIDPSANVEEGADWYFVQFYKGFLKCVKEKGAPLDFFSWHSYSNVEQNLVYANYVRETLDEEGFIKTESHCNEWNPGIADRCTVRDAVNVAGNMLMWQNAPIDMAVYYNARILSSYGGLYNPIDKTPSKVFYVFKAFNNLYKLKNQTKSEVSDKDIYAVAARQGEDVAVMAVNFGKEDKEVIACGFEKIRNKKIYVINETFSLEEPAMLTDGNVLHGETIVLITGKL